MTFLCHRLLAVPLSCMLAVASSAAFAARSSQASHANPQVAAAIGRSAIVLGRPNLLPIEAMPLGNGRLGAAVWSQHGLTVQLNRSDTLPDRLSPGQVNLPGLTRLTGAKDYSGKLDLYNGAFVERGGGMTATVYVQPASDTLIIDVAGADPSQPQQVLLSLWAPRAPKATAGKNLGLLAESWIDNTRPGASNLPFGSLAAVTAEGRDVTVSVSGARTITLSVQPKANGSFRVLVAAPHFNGDEPAETAARRELKATGNDNHQLWWNHFWQHAGLLQVTSADGSGEYMENLRNIYLFSSAAESGAKIPGSQAGIADMLSAVKDTHHWSPGAFWHWNLRMQVAANLGAGVPELNAPYFSLYRDNLANIEDWTKKHMSGLPGICIPETMRFNGPGIEYESWNGADKPIIGLNCDAGSKPYYNARTISTGGEVSFWIWQQYLQTDDRAFLEANYPVMAAAARFLLAYEKRGDDKLLHTSPSNAHENQWDVLDPTNDLLARKTLFANTVAAATLLGKDGALVAQLKSEQPLIPELPRTQVNDPVSLITAGSSPEQQDVIADSYEPAAKRHNVENTGLEAVWPYGLIGEDSSLYPLARRTYLHRPFPTNQDWSFDPIQAARLGLGDEVGATLVKLTEIYQAFPNGLANWGGDSGEFYIEQSGVVTTALQEALVQDYDGTIRIAPAIPTGWDFDGTVFIRDNTSVHVQTRQGHAAKIVIEAGKSGELKLRNPWPGTAVDVTGTGLHGPVLRNAAGPLLTFPVVAGHRYDVHQSADAHREPQAQLAPVAVSAAGARKLGDRQIGLDPRP